METLTQPYVEAAQSGGDIEAYVDGMTVAYRPRFDAQRTEYFGDTAMIIDGGEAGFENSVGSFDIGETSLPVLAKFTVPNGEQTHTPDASPESEFLVVDVRGLGLNDSQGTSVVSFKGNLDMARSFGKVNTAEDAPQYALVNLTAIQRRSRDGGSLFSINTISRDPKNPTIIRRDHTLHGEATADGLSGLGLGESNIALASDSDGKLVVLMDQASNGPIQLESANALRAEYAQQSAEADSDAEELLRKRRLLGRWALKGWSTSDTFKQYESTDSLRSGWVRSARYNSDETVINSGYGGGDTRGEPSAQVSTPESSTAGVGSLLTADDVYDRIADLRRANVSDKDIKKSLLKELHPDFNPGVNPDLAKVVTNEFRPKPQEYRNGSAESQAAHAEPAPNPESKPTSASGATDTKAPSTEVVSVSAPASQKQPKQPSQPVADDYTTAA